MVYLRAVVDANWIINAFGAGIAARTDFLGLAPESPGPGNFINGYAFGHPRYQSGITGVHGPDKRD